MKKLLIITIVVLVAGGITSWVIKNRHNQDVSPAPIMNSEPMALSSPAFNNGQEIPDKYSCNGEGINPPLRFSGVPANAQTLALTVTDPDAPTGLWVHWLVWNIATSTAQVEENSLPQGAVQGQGSSGQKIYQAPCPPSGTHRYIFDLYALGSKLNIPSYSQLTDLTSAMQGHVLQQAQLTGLYSKK